MPLSPEDCATLTAYIQGVDHTVREAELRWGVDRLPLLVDAELRAKFNRQVVRWRAAIEAAWEADVLTRDLLDAATAKASAMQRAYAALDAAASEAGHRPLSADVWEARLHDGTVAVIVRTLAEASAVVADGRALNVYSLDEIANIIDALPPALARAKIVFPGSTIEPPRRDLSWIRNGEEIPF